MEAKKITHENFDQAMNLVLTGKYAFYISTYGSLMCIKKRHIEQWRKVELELLFKDGNGFRIRKSAKRSDYIFLGNLFIQEI